jgi:glycosyltransferase involved in cell wall biosynthesis
MKKIIHIINGLGSGGAENMLYKLLKYSDKERYYHEVISLLDEGVIGEKIKTLGIKVHCLNINKKNLLKAFIKVKTICKEFDIVNTWLYHADVIGFIVGKILLNKKVIWNVRHSNLDIGANKPGTLRVVKINSILSNYVDCITYNSKLAYTNHKEVGYINRMSVTIPNGFELDKFKSDPKNRNKIRESLSIREEENVIITIGRWNVQKDYVTLLKALSELKKQKVNFKQIMVGTNLDNSNNELSDLIEKYNLRENLLLLGRRDDIPFILTCADIYVSSSLGESFSNAIGEAMACELPCVVTDVGDSKYIVGETGFTVDPKDYLGLASKIQNIITNSKNEHLGKMARSRVIQNFDINNVIKLYEEIYEA